MNCFVKYLEKYLFKIINNCVCFVDILVFYSKSYDLSIPDNIDEFDKSGSQKNIRSYPKYLKGIQRMANIQNDYKGETMQQKVKKNNINVDDEDEIYNNPNFHSEEQNEFELPDGN
ncbi:hypothetical protein RhiirA4_477855 [Rhizophagus irregularis]|uniref:Uncharacterized protein n=1 Tax=Rhizophagus irregularis TaxID=588596 RepID=A0A2I1HB79_9GLOM|nr:hypothetical protein RhiirA4_476208 [Rhizophagus irregularis]PKY57055.1 hypothetical protein RhiirA4_477855 [Rhizophagus irregularis]